MSQAEVVSLTGLNGTVEKNGQPRRPDFKVNQHLEPHELVAPAKAVAPDGGYAWIVMVASFFVNVIVDGVIFSFAVIKSPLQEKFQANAGNIAWVGSMMTGFYLLAGPFVSGLCNKFGARITAIVGSIIAAAAIAISSFSTSLGMLFCFYGVIAGIGMGMVYLPSIVIVGEYFSKRRAFATGVVVSGSGVGGFIFPPLFKALLDKYELWETLLIIAAIVLNCAICGSFFRPLQPVVRRPPHPPDHLQRNDGLKHPDQQERLILPQSAPNENGLDKAQTNRVDTVATESLAQDEKAGDSGEDVGRLAKNKVVVNKGIWKCCPDMVGSVLHQMLDLSLLRSPTFVLTCIMSFLSLAGIFIPFVFIRDLASERGVLEGQQLSVLMAISVTNTLGRIFFGIIADRPCLDASTVVGVALTAGGIATCLVPFVSGFYAFYLFVGYALLFGLAISAFAALRSIILVELFGIALLNNSFGLQTLFQGVATLVGSPIGGSIHDATGTYSSTFYYAGTLIAVSGVLLFPAKLLRRLELRREDRHVANKEADP